MMSVALPSEDGSRCMSTRRMRGKVGGMAFVYVAPRSHTLSRFSFACLTCSFREIPWCCMYNNTQDTSEGQSQAHMAASPALTCERTWLLRFVFDAYFFLHCLHGKFLSLSCCNAGTHNST